MGNNSPVEGYTTRNRPGVGDSREVRLLCFGDGRGRRNGVDHDVVGGNVGNGMNGRRKTRGGWAPRWLINKMRDKKKGMRTEKEEKDSAEL